MLPDDPKEAAAIRKKLLDSITMRSSEHYIIARMMESYSVAFHIKRHMRHSGKLTEVGAELTNLDLSSETGLEGLVIIGRRCRLRHRLC